MSKKFTITESEKEMIRSLYLMENNISESRSLSSDEERNKRFDVGAGLGGGVLRFQVYGIEKDKNLVGVYKILTNQVNLKRGSPKLFGGQKNFHFNCSTKNQINEYTVNGNVDKNRVYTGDKSETLKRFLEVMSNNRCD